MKMPTRILAMAIAVIAATGWACAQPPEGGDAPQGKPEDSRPDRGPRGYDGHRPDWGDKDVRELIDTVMLVRASKQLELTDDQTVVFVRRFNEEREKYRKQFETRYAAHKALREALEQKLPDATIQERLNVVMENDKRLTEMRYESFTLMAEGLNTAQQAQLYVFLQEFESNLRRLIEKARESRITGPRDGDSERRWDGNMRQRPDGDDPNNPHAPRPPMVPGPGAAPPPPPPDAKPAPEAN